MKPKNLKQYEDSLSNNKPCYLDVDEWEDIAFYYEMSANYAEALSAIEHGLELHPSSIDLAIKQAKYLLYCDRIEEAAEAMQKLAGSSIEELFILAEISLIQGDPESGLAYVRDIENHERITLEDCYDIIDLLADYNFFDEMIHFVKDIAIHVEDSSDILRQAAILLEEKQEYSMAITLFNEILDNNPYSVEDWLYLSRTYALLQEYEKAIEACDFAIAIDDSDGKSTLFKGYCRYDMQEYELAIDCFKQYIEQFPQLSIGYELAAECYARKEKYDDAIRFLLKAYENNRDDEGILYQIALQYFEINDLDNCIIYLQKALAIAPDDAPSLALLGELKFSLNELDEAEKALNLSLNIDEENAAVWYILGEIYLARQDYLTAKGNYIKAHEIDSTDPKILFKIITTFHLLKDDETLKEYIDKLNYLIENVAILPVDEIRKTEIQEAATMIEKINTILETGLDINKDNNNIK